MFTQVVLLLETDGRGGCKWAAKCFEFMSDVRFPQAGWAPATAFEGSGLNATPPKC